MFANLTDEQLFEELNNHRTMDICRKYGVTHGTIWYHKKRLGIFVPEKKDPELIIHDDYIEYRDGYGRSFKADIEDYDILMKYKWYVNRYVKADNNKKTLLFHRIVMNCDEDHVVDHINHDTTDNRKSNLRVVTQSQNSMNRRMLRNNTSGYMGVFWNSQRQKWCSVIEVNKKRINLGQFKNKNKAIKAREIAENKYFGDFSFANKGG